jgi:hypothetical protein
MRCGDERRRGWEAMECSGGMQAWRGEERRCGEDKSRERRWSGVVVG